MLQYVAEVKTLKITAGILFYWLNEQGNTQHILHGADKEELTKIERYDKQRATQPGTLYLSPEADGMLCFCAHGKAPLSKTIIDGLKSKKQKPANEMFSALWIPGKPDAEWIYREWTHLLQLITDFLEKIASQEPIEQMMRSAEPILRSDFSLIDRDMYVIYGSSNISEKMFAKLGERYSDEIVESLIMSKDFHDVATRTKPFYYYMDLTEQWSYCINIREDDYYFARLVVNANEAEEKLPSGAEQITEILAEQITRMIIRGILKLQHNEEDPLHLLCAQIAEGNPPDAAKLREITTLRDLSSSVYQVMCLEPYKASGWETQMETTLPVAVRKLEQTWPGSCAIAAENKILWLVMHNGPIRTEERYAFYQQLLLFLRETVFRAGASTAFSDLTKIADAFDQLHFHFHLLAIVSGAAGNILEHSFCFR